MNHFQFKLDLPPILFNLNFVMRVSDFNFDLPDELIARYPKTDRVSCRLLQLNGENGEIFTALF